MENLSDVYVTDYIPTIYTRPRTFEYTQNGIVRKSGIMAERNGVCIIIYNKTRDVLVLVKQFRASVYLSQISDEDAFGSVIDTEKYPPKSAVMIEFCAGLEDKHKPTIDIAIDEVYEECGYQVTTENLERIGEIANMNVGTGARTTFYYCEVSDEMRVSSGGGVAEEGENIEVLEMAVQDVIKYVNQKYCPSPANFLFGFYWFLYNKYRK